MRCDGPAGASAPAGRRIFFSTLGKILILLELRRGYLASSAQNLGSKGLTGKILRNKELAVETRAAARASDWDLVRAHGSIVRFLFARSRLYVTWGQLFVVHNCGKPDGASQAFSLHLSGSLRFREATGWVLPQSRNTYGGVTVADRALAQLGDQIGSEALVNREQDHSLGKQVRIPFLHPDLIALCAATG